jgi:predicted Fe-Mo cluster-binding NifX family protein
MKILFTAKGEEWDSPMDPRFGRAMYLLVYNTDSDKMDIIDNSAVDEEAHGAGTKTSSAVAGLAPDIIITGNGPGGNAASALAATGVKLYTGAGDMKVEEAYNAWKNNLLKEFKF